MRIADENVVAQKVAIWGGIWAAEQKGCSIGVSIVFSILFFFDGVTSS